ncbi:hypothetical protein D3C80_540330 [compost metagenome]
MHRFGKFTQKCPEAFADGMPPDRHDVESAVLLEHLLAGQLLGLIGEAVPRGFLFDEDLQVEIPGLVAIEQADRHGMEVVGLEPVVQVRTTAATESTLGPVGRIIDARRTPLDQRRLAAVDHQQRAAGPLAAHAAMTSADMGIVDGDRQPRVAAQAGALFFQGHGWLLECKDGPAIIEARRESRLLAAFVLCETAQPKRAGCLLQGIALTARCTQYHAGTTPPAH